MHYHLGTSDAEQRRLVEQREYYGDTQDLRFDSHSRVCELGCGPLSNFWLPAQLPDGSYVGIDISADQVRAGEARAHALNLKNVELKIANAATTGLPSSDFDAVFARCLLIHLSDPQAVVREAGRLARPAARIILIEPHDPSYYVSPHTENLMEAYRARVEIAYGGGRGTPDVALSLRGLLIDAGAKNVRLRQHSISVTGDDKVRCSWFLSNLVRMIEPTIPEALRLKLIEPETWEAAKREAAKVHPATFLYQSMWIAEAER